MNSPTFDPKAAAKAAKLAAKGATAPTANVESTEGEINLTEGLEDEASDEHDNDLLEGEIPEGTTGSNYANREWLEANEPEFPVELTSKKFDAEREPKVQAGLKLIAELMEGKINPLILLLGKWWEVKPARAAIKKLIDAEAASLSRPEDHYMQVDCRENVDKLSMIQNAVDRLRYSITYFKPRGGLSSKDLFKQFIIKGATYNVNLTKLAELKAKYPTPEEKEQLFADVIAISQKIETDEL